MPDDLLDKGQTAYVIIDDKRYRPEQELADRYRSFVSEILKLSLAGLAVFSFIYKTGLPPHGEIGLKDFFALSGIAMFALSAASALFFLYSACEGLRWYIAGVRYASPFFEAEGSTAPPAPSTESVIDDYLEERMVWIKRCRWSKLAAAVLLGGGGIFVALAIVIH